MLPLSSKYAIKDETARTWSSAPFLITNEGKFVMTEKIIRKEYGRGKYISKEIADEAIRLYQSGMTVPPIGKKLNVGKSAIYNILEKNDVKCRSRGHWRNKALGKEEEIISSYKNGLSMREVGKKFNMSEKSVLLLLRRSDVKSRPSGKHDASKSPNWKGGISKTIEYKRAKCKKFTKIYIETKPLFKLTLILRSRISDCFREAKRGKFPGFIKNKSTTELLGAEITVVMKHLESQFTKGMTWQNHSRKGWHIDHIIPLASAKTEEELIKLFHYTNLQPLWAKDNHQKHSKLNWRKSCLQLREKQAWEFAIAAVKSDLI